MRTILSFLTVLGCTILASGPALAQGTARSMDFDPSIRAAGMGDASTAVFFGDEFNTWANPALLGYTSGLRYERGRTELLPELASDIILSSETLRLGGGGLGLIVSGRPIFQGVKLDYGSSDQTDPGGNVVSTFGSFEAVESWGFGLSALRATESVWRLLGRDARGWSRFGDVSFGMSLKRTRIFLDPAYEASAKTMDWGGLARVTPWNSIDSDRGLAGRLDLAFGYSVLNADDARFDFGASGSAPPTRQKRTGVAARLALDPPIRALESHGPRGWFLEGFHPLLTLGVARDGIRASAGGGPPRRDLSGWGGELECLRVVALRIGQYDDDLSDIRGSTFGYALSLPIGTAGGLRYEAARFPRISGLDDLKRRAFSLWFDPLEVWKLRHPEPNSP